MYFERVRAWKGEFAQIRNKIEKNHFFMRKMQTRIKEFCGIPPRPPKTRKFLVQKRQNTRWKWRFWGVFDQFSRPNSAAFRGKTSNGDFGAKSPKSAVSGQNGKKTAKNCKTPVLSYFQTGYGKFGGKNLNFSEKAENFALHARSCLAGLFRQRSTTSSECSQRAGFYLCWHLPSPSSSSKTTLRAQALSWTCAWTPRSSALTERHARRLWMPGAQPRPTARCRTVASMQCAEQTSFDLRCGSLVAPQSPPQQRNDRNLTPKQKLRGYPPNSQKMMRTSFMDRRANLIKTKSMRTSSCGKMDEHIGYVTVVFAIGLWAGGWCCRCWPWADRAANLTHFTYILLAKLQFVGQRLFWLRERSLLNNVDSSSRQGPSQPKTNKSIESTGTKTLCEFGCLNLPQNVSPICLKKRETAHPAIC